VGFLCLSGDWIPASAGMTTPTVVPAKAGTQADARLGITRKLQLFASCKEKRYGTFDAVF
jgi:hypothetical protein